MSKFVKIVFSTMLLIAVFTATAIAQTATATIKGVVADGNNNVAAGAVVMLTQTSTALKRTFTTGESGQYTFTFIEPGQYTLEAQTRGFKTFRQDNLTLEVAQQAELNITLQPGDISDTVTVTAGETALQLDTASGSLGGVVDRRQIDSLPLNGRNVMQLAQLEPGVNSSPGSRRANPGGGAGGYAEISINGGRTLTNEVVVDGVPITNKADNLVSLRPSADAVQEFRVVTNAYSAEYGRTGGGALNFSTRAGTSKIRATLWEFIRNDYFDATAFFSNASGQGKEKLRFNQFGGNIGGPVWLPSFGEGGAAVKKLDKLFFFFNYEALRLPSTNLRTSTVPTAKMRGGDFSELLGAAIPNVGVVDTNGKAIPAQQGMIYVPGALVVAGKPGAGSRVVFANNIIPASLINPVGKNAVAYYPLPNQTGLINNYLINSPLNSSDNQFIARLDYNLSARQQVYGRIIQERDVSTNAGPFPGNLASTQNNMNSQQRPGTIGLDYVNTLTPRLVLHVNGGWTRQSVVTQTISDGFDPTSLGFPSYLANASGDRQFPSFAPTGYATLGPARSFGSTKNKQDSFSFNQELSLLRSAHSFKFGANERAYRIYNHRADDPMGNFGFTRAFTARTANDIISGDAIASFLLGNPATGRLGIAPDPAVQNLYYAFFAQDDWKVNRRLTLNLGLRWEADLGNTERFDRLTNFDFTAQFPVSSLNVAFPAATNLGTRTLPLRGIITPVGRSGVEAREQFDRDLNNFGPRIGLAFKLNDKTVLRAGGGIFYGSSSGGGFSNATYALADLAETGFIATLDNVTPTPGTNLSNPFSNGIVRPSGKYDGPLTNYGQQLLSVRLRNIHQPKIGQWNLSLQRELPGHLIAQVAYAGSASISMLGGPTDINQLTDEVQALGATVLNTTVSNPFLTLPVEQRPAATSILGRATVTVGQLLRPYPQFGRIQSYNANEAHASYHSLQTKLARRFNDGLDFTVAYTFAKTIDDISGISAGPTIQVPNYQNYYNRRADKSLSTFDVKHRFIGNVTYQLPFGGGRRYLKEGVAGKVFGGFAANAIVQAQSGFPISVTAVNAALLGLSFTQLRPNLVGDPKLSAERSKADQIAQWFNPAAFVQPAQYTFGNAPRVLPNVRGPGHFSTNVSIQRNFKITETIRFQFRAESYNVFNRANFTTPSAVLGANNFGRIINTEDPRQFQFGAKLYF
ncbi:MAG: carboxypeptidase regulatory-like domain-containing protein [Blastocatellia bacterium]